MTSKQHTDPGAGSAILLEEALRSARRRGKRILILNVFWIAAFLTLSSILVKSTTDFERANRELSDQRNELARHRESILDLLSESKEAAREVDQRLRNMEGLRLRQINSLPKNERRSSALEITDRIMRKPGEKRYVSDAEIAYLRSYLPVADPGVSSLIQGALRLKRPEEDYSRMGETDVDLLKSAVSSFRSCSDRKPIHLQCQTGIGLAYLELQEYEKAANAFNKLVAMAPQEPEAYVLRAFARRRLGSLLELQQGLEQIDQATNDTLRSLEIDADNASAYAELSQCLAWKETRDLPTELTGIFPQKNKCNSALECADRAIKTDPLYGRAYHLRGVLNLNESNYEDAQRDLTIAEQWYISRILRAGILENIGLMHLRKKEWREALGVAKRVRKIVVDSEWNIFVEAAAYLEIGDYEAAKNRYREWIRVRDSEEYNADPVGLKQYLHHRWHACVDGISLRDCDSSETKTRDKFI